MTFPDVPRVLYGKNPLETVICQLRFPPILRIDAETPANFQDQIRHSYPLYKQRSPLDEGVEIPQELAKLMGLGLQLQSSKQGYEFSSGDNLWEVVLTRDFLALTTKKYERWEDFKAHLDGPLAALKEVYQPDYFMRIGLRYRDVIKKSLLGLKEYSWSQLLKPHISSELSSEIAGSIKKTGRELLVSLDGGIGSVRIRHGMTQVKDSDETWYIIDADFYTDERTEVDHAVERLDRFNREARGLFKWCIDDRLHTAMEPRPL
jgi:uncharacterized protein (TIGR04255 family)